MAALRQKISTERAVQRYRLDYDSENAAKLISTAYAELVKACGGRETEKSKELVSRIRMVSDWVTGKGSHSLLMYGTYGSGKTTMASAVFETAMYLEKDIRKKPLMYSAKRLASDPDIEVRRKHAGLLIVDEFGREQTERREYGNIYEPLIDLIVYRQKYMLPTIMVTNLLEEEILDRYGPYIYDRIWADYERIYFQGESYRKKK